MEPSVTDLEDKQDIEDESNIEDERLASSSPPVIRYKKYYQDLPKKYCCRAMKEGVEDIEFIQYCQYYDEYSFSSYHGYPLSKMMYCPYCGKEIESLRALRSSIKFNYLRERGWDIDEVDRYWDLFREGKSQEEAERIVEQERQALPVQE